MALFSCLKAECESSPQALSPALGPPAQVYQSAAHFAGRGCVPIAAVATRSMAASPGESLSYLTFGNDCRRARGISSSWGCGL